MRQAQRKKEKDRVAIALMLAFCVIALTSIFTIKTNIDKINGSARQNPLPVSDRAPTSSLEKSSGASQKPEASTSQSGVKTADTAGANVPTVDSKQKPAAREAQAPRFCKPIKGNAYTVTNPYAMEHLLYSITLDQYMTHCGTDIEADADTQVLAVADGTVTAVYTDDRYGLSVEITHPHDMMTIYSNLSTNEMVEVGDTIKQGQIIGGVGATGLFEALEPPHLHFEMLQDGVYVDPQEHIEF